MNPFVERTEALFKACIDEFTTINDLVDSCEPVYSQRESLNEDQLEEKSTGSAWLRASPFDDVIAGDLTFTSGDLDEFSDSVNLKIDNGIADAEQSSQRMNKAYDKDNQDFSADFFGGFKRLHSTSFPSESMVNLPSSSTTQHQSFSNAASINVTESSQDVEKPGHSKLDCFKYLSPGVSGPESPKVSDSFPNEPLYTQKDWKFFIASLKASSSKGRRTMCTCTYCPKQFSRKTERNKHEKSHTLPYKCSTHGCGKGFPSPKDRDRHMSCHKKNCWFCGAVSCASVGKSFSRKDHLVRHLKNIHGLEVETKDLRPSLEVPNTTLSDYLAPRVVTGLSLPIKVETKPTGEAIYPSSPDGQSTSSITNTESSSGDHTIPQLETSIGGNSLHFRGTAKKEAATTSVPAHIKLEARNIKMEDIPFSTPSVDWPVEERDRPATKVESP